MIFAVEGFVETVCPAVTVVPVEVARYGEVEIEGGWIGDIADESIHPDRVSCEPVWIKVSDDGGCVDEVTVTSPSISSLFGTVMRRKRNILEVVVIVVSVAKIITGVSSRIRSTRYNASPGSLVHKRIDLLVVCKHSKSCFKFYKTCLC